VSARGFAMRRPYWISTVGHAAMLSALVWVSGLQAPRLFVEGVNIVLPPPGTGPGTVRPAATAPRQNATPSPVPEEPSAPPEEKKRPQPERNIVQDPSPDGLLPPPKDDVPSLRPEARDTPPAPKAGPPQTKKSGGPVASGPGGEAGVPVGGATGTGSGTGIGVEGGVLGAHAPWYLVQLRDKIAANWRPPATVGRSGEMRAAFHFRVAPDGSVEAVEAAGSSNHFQYDIAARRAIEMSSPLPPLPEELGAGAIGITLTFTQVY